MIGLPGVPGPHWLTLYARFGAPLVGVAFGYGLFLCARWESRRA